MNQPQIDELQWLHYWYLSQCNGDWEHSYGITIATLDNPGWHLRIELTETDLESELFPGNEQRRSEHDWLRCSVEDGVF
jgi:hypothetical protein